MTKNTKDTKLETVGNSMFLKMKKAQIIIRNEQVIGSSPIGSSRGENAEIIDINGLGVFLFVFSPHTVWNGERIFRFLFKRSGRDTDHSHFF